MNRYMGEKARQGGHFSTLLNTELTPSILRKINAVTNSSSVWLPFLEGIKYVSRPNTVFHLKY